MRKYRPFKLFVVLHTLAYRLSGGKIGGHMGKFNVALLTTTGRKSGRSLTRPLGYFERPEGYVIVASNSGSTRHPAWYYNLKNDPQAAIQVLDKRISVTAEVLTGEARSKTWDQITASVPLYAEYEKEAAREIPLILLRPDKSTG